MSPRRTVLVLGGTGEGGALAAMLADAPGLRVVTSLAGVTRRPAPLAGEVRRGGFGGAPGLALYLHEADVGAVVDATHPFAVTISANAVQACRQACRPLLRLQRPAWAPLPGDRWHDVADLVAAVPVTARLGRRVFLATGLRGIGPFEALPDAWFLLRAVEPPAAPIALADYRLLLERGPFDPSRERALLTRNRIEVLVTRNAGGEGARAKVDAARALGLPVVMVRRPELEPATEAPSVAEAAAWARAHAAI